MAILLGVIAKGTDVGKTQVRMNQGLQVQAAKFDADFLKAVQADLKTIIEAKKLKLAVNAAWDESLHPRGKGGRFARSQVAKDTKAGRRAMRIVLNQKRDQPEVLRRGPLRIDFEYGHPGNPEAAREDGYGISHAAKKHPEDLRRLPVTIARGSIHEHESPEKAYVVHGDHLAILRRSERNDGAFSQTRYNVTTHLKDGKTALRAKQRTVLVEGR
jgi:hypothetical protein